MPYQIVRFDCPNLSNQPDGVLIGTMESFDDAETTVRALAEKEFRPGGAAHQDFMNSLAAWFDIPKAILAEGLEALAVPLLLESAKMGDFDSLETALEQWRLDDLSNVGYPVWQLMWYAEEAPADEDADDCGQASSEWSLRDDSVWLTANVDLYDAAPIRQ